MQLLFLCHARAWNPSLARGSRCSRRVNGALAKCLMRWERSCGQSTCEVPEALRVQSAVCGAEVLSPRIDRQLWRKSRMHGMRLLCAASLVSVRNRVCCVHNRARIVHGSSVLEICLGVTCKKAHCLFCPCTHTRSRLLFALPPGWSILVLQRHNPERALLLYLIRDPDEY